MIPHRSAIFVRSDTIVSLAWSCVKKISLTFPGNESTVFSFILSLTPCIILFMNSNAVSVVVLL